MGQRRTASPKKPPASAPLPLEVPRRAGWGILAAILVLAALLRLMNLGQSPPGLNQDEAVIAWNSWCLLKTGKDQAGKSWPIFYARALGVPHDTLSIYAPMPFQAIGGLNTVTTRLPAAVGGIITVLLAYWVGARLFGRTAGLAAALFLALNPWHIQQCRWGHEAPLCPLLIMASIAVLLRSNLPLAEPRRSAAETGTPPQPTTLSGPEPALPNVWLAALGGAMVGISCYGYAAIKLFFPVFLVACVAANWRAWWNLLKTRRGAAAFAAAALGLAVTFGPLAWKQLTDPEMTARGETTFLWKAPPGMPAPSTAEAAGKVIGRYFNHFLPDFLFLRGDLYPIQSPPDMGLFHWYMLPLMALGVVFVLAKVRSSPAHRFLLAWVLVYPVPDSLSAHYAGGEASLHALRSLPGICSLLVLGAVGAVEAGRWLLKRNRSTAMAAGAALALAMVILNVRYLSVFFGEFNRRPAVYHGFQADLTAACDWLRPQYKDVDAVFCSVDGMNVPYIITLVGLGLDPAEWSKGEPNFIRPARDFKNGFVYLDDRRPGEWTLCTRYGKMNFLYTPVLPTAEGRLVPQEPLWLPALDAFRKGLRHGRIVFIIHPGEEAFVRQYAGDLGKKVHEIVGPSGPGDRLVIYEKTL